MLRNSVLYLNPVQTKVMFICLPLTLKFVFNSWWIPEFFNDELSTTGHICDVVCKRWISAMFSGSWVDLRREKLEFPPPKLTCRLSAHQKRVMGQTHKLPTLGQIKLTNSLAWRKLTNFLGWTKSTNSLGRTNFRLIRDQVVHLWNSGRVKQITFRQWLFVRHRTWNLICYSYGSLKFSLNFTVVWNFDKLQLLYVSLGLRSAFGEGRWFGWE